MIGELRVESGGNLVSQVAWEFALSTSGHDKQLLGIKKKLHVNGEQLLLVSYDKLQQRELLSTPDKTELLGKTSFIVIHWYVTYTQLFDLNKKLLVNGKQPLLFTYNQLQQQ